MGLRGWGQEGLKLVLLAAAKRDMDSRECRKKLCDGYFNLTPTPATDYHAQLTLPISRLWT